jgi:hypothetical protein
MPTDGRKIANALFRTNGKVAVGSASAENIKAVIESRSCAIWTITTLKRASRNEYDLSERR